MGDDPGDDEAGHPVRGPEGHRDASRDEPRRDQPDAAPSEPVREPAAGDLADDVGEGLRAEGERSEANVEALPDDVGHECLDHALVEDPDRDRAAEEGPETSSPHGSADAVAAAPAPDRPRPQ